MMNRFFDWIMDFIFNLAQAALMLLPDSPFASEEFTNTMAKFTEIMENINYFIPFNDMFLFMGIYLVAVLIWYGLRWVLRWAKYID